MADNDPRLDRLLERLNELEKKQNRFRTEIEEIRSEIRHFSGSEIDKSDLKPVDLQDHPATKQSELNTGNPEPGRLTKMLQKEKSGASGSGWSARFGSGSGFDLETFIGENLISKIGIVITIIGVAIGARYAIDNDLISPLMRVLLGYALGAVLLLFSLKLKESMIRFSAVLFSGSMSIFYIITFAAHSFYSLFPEALAFGLMVLITVITVASSVYLNMEPVAHIALVGAYAIPYLVGGEGSISSFFIYMVIINAGVLFTAVYKYWKPLTYSAFFFTWMIYGSWYWGDYSPQTDFVSGITYASAFFLIFYMAVLAYKLLREEQYVRSDIWLFLANAFVFYAFGFGLISGSGIAENRAGLFTLANALIHGAAAIIVYRSGFSDRNLLYLITGLAITFLTLAIPVELDGSWVTLLWSAEAALLFTIGRSNGVSFYEKMSHPVLALAFLALLIDWENGYSLYQLENAENLMYPILNIHFFTSLFFIAASGWMVWKDSHAEENIRGVYQNPGLNKLVTQLLRLAVVVAVFAAFRLEISGYFNQLYIESKPVNGPGSLAGFVTGNDDLLRFGTMWGYSYTMLFIGGLILLLADRIRSHELTVLLFAATAVCTASFLYSGFEDLNFLHDHYES
jgi:uncharacterized membrane protein